eukprot:g40254.t1
MKNLEIQPLLANRIPTNTSRDRERPNGTEKESPEPGHGSRAKFPSLPFLRRKTDPHAELQASSPGYDPGQLPALPALSPALASPLATLKHCIKKMTIRGVETMLTAGQDQNFTFECIELGNPLKKLALGKKYALRKNVF